MSLDPITLLAIAGMAIATYACRAGGYWLFRQIRPTPFLRDMLRYLPGALFMAYVTPGLAQGGVKEWAGAAATVGTMLATRSITASIGVGTAACWVMWMAT